MASFCSGLVEVPDPARFERIFVVTPDDIDELDHVNNVVYLRWVQEVAIAHWRNAATSEQIVEILWVAIRHEIDYEAPAFLGDQITARTWVEKWTRTTSERHTEIIRDLDRTVLARARTIWAAIDPDSQRPRRLGKGIAERFMAHD